MSNLTSDFTISSNQRRSISVNISSQDPERTISVSDESCTRDLTHYGTSSYVKALARLRYLRRYTDGWDGPGSRSADASSFKFAEDFLGLLAGVGSLFRVNALIYAPGTAVLSISSPTLAASLEFLADGTIAANIDDENGEHDLDIAGFNGIQIPDELGAFLRPNIPHAA